MDYIRLAIDYIITKREAYNRSETYYEGTQPELFLNQRWFKLFKNNTGDFRFNFSKTVVDAVLNRLEIEQVESDSPVADEYFSELLEQPDIRIDMNEIHRNALIYGDAYAIVWPDETGKMAIDYNSPLSTVIIYDQENPRKKLFAAKMWQYADYNVKKVYLNLYFPDRIEKYEGMGEVEYLGSAQGINFNLYDTVPNPWGEIPVFHFRTHKPYGRPEHADAFGPQDAINKLISTHMLTVDYQGAPQRYALANGGSTAELDDFSEGETARENIAALQNGPGQLWYLQGVTAVGQFAAADPDTFTKPVHEFVNQMAAITSTPVHYFSSTGYLPSGQALRVSEAPLTKKIKNRQMSFESSWRDLFLFMLKIEGITANIDIDWATIETVDAVDNWDVAVRKKSVGMPLEQILLELDYDPEIAKVISAEASTANAAVQQAQSSTEISLRGTGLNTNNLALQQAAADNSTGE
jgi:SPP1 family phage portal protein